MHFTLEYGGIWSNRALDFNGRGVSIQMFPVIDIHLNFCVIGVSEDFLFDILDWVIAAQ